MKALIIFVLALFLFVVAGINLYKSLKKSEYTIPIDSKRIVLCNGYFTTDNGKNKSHVPDGHCLRAVLKTYEEIENEDFLEEK